MSPYVGGRPIEEVQRELGIQSLIKLASNENPRGPSQRVFKAMQAACRDVNRYPDGNGYYLKQMLAEKHEVPAEFITLGNGSNDILELIAQAYLRPGDTAVYSAYSFIVYAMVVKKSGAKAVVVDARDFAHDLDRMAAACDDSTRVLFLANPNNPTGTCFSHRELVGLLDSVSSETLVVLDEAYVEYAPELYQRVAGDGDVYPDSSALLQAYPNLLVTRSFSKAYGLGGLRIGYSLSHPAVADVLNRARQPFNVSNVALAAAKAAVEDDEYIRDSVRINNEELERMQIELSAIGVRCIDSCANFLTMDCASIGKDASLLEQQLLERGVILRGLAVYAMPQHLRVSIGLPEENERFLDVLKSLNHE